MNGLNCVKGEIHNVLAQLRISGRSRYTTSISFFDFGLGSSSQQSNNIESLRHKLLASFKELHLFLGFHSDLHEIDSVIWMRPFLDVVLSDIRGVDVMNVTLTSIHKFLLYSLITDRSVNCEQALHDIIYAIIHAKFDYHSRSDSELIHIRLMEVLLETLRCPSGYLVSDNNVCLSIQKCFEMRKIHYAYSINNLMVRYTENVLIQILMIVFTKCQHIHLLRQNQNDNDNKNTNTHTNTATNTSTSTTIRIHTNSQHRHRHRNRNQSEDANIIISKEAQQGFGIRAMCRILRYLTHIINPNLNTHETSPDLREFGLRLINVSLETGGEHLNRYPSLIHIICDDLCRQLLTNSQSHHFGILSLTLRIIFDLFNVVKQAIRVQLEVFFISIHLRIAESDSSSFEQKELVLESIVEFCREPLLIVGLYTNYDCQIGYSDLFHDIIKFLAEQATPPSIEELTELHLIAAEGILAIIDCIARKFCNHSIIRKKRKKKKNKNKNQTQIKQNQNQNQNQNSNGSVAGNNVNTVHNHNGDTNNNNNGNEIGIGIGIDIEHKSDSNDNELEVDEEEEEEEEEEELKQQLRAIETQQRMKRKLKKGAKYFNERCEKSFPDLQLINLLETPLSAKNVAEFLRTNPYLDKVQIGVFLGKNKEFHSLVLDEYISNFDFRSLSIDEALRLFLESFVLRGEAQVISHIIEKFSDKLFVETADESPLETTDASFLLAYSIIQLNTDAHNDQIKKKMTFESYVKNVKGLNNKKDFPLAYLNQIYGSIVHNEIKIRSGNPRDIFTAKKSASYYDLNDENINRMNGNGDQSHGHHSHSNVELMSNHAHHGSSSSIHSDDPHGGGGGGEHRSTNSQSTNANATTRHDNEYELERSVSSASAASNSSFNNVDAMSNHSQSEIRFDGGGHDLHNNVKEVKKAEWKQVLKKGQSFGRFSTIAPHSNGSQMFSILWPQALNILAFHLRYARHPKVLDRICQGIQTMAKIAHCYQIRAAFNAIIHCLSQNLMRCLFQFGSKHGLLPSTFDSAVYVHPRQPSSPSASSTSLSSANSSSMHSPKSGQGRYESISVPYFISAKSSPRGSGISDIFDNMDDGNGYQASATNAAMSDTLALDIRISFTVKIFFLLVRSYGGLLMTDGWSSVMKIILWLFHLELLPHELFFSMDDFTDADSNPLPSLGDPLGDSTNDANANYDQSTASAVASWISSAFSSMFYDSNAAANPIEKDGNPDFILQYDVENGDAAPAISIEHQSNTDRNRNHNHNHNESHDNSKHSHELPLKNENAANANANADTISGADAIRNANGLALHYPSNPKCQNIIDSLKESQICELFSMSAEYHLNTFVHFVRILISLSKTDIENTITSLDAGPVKSVTLLQENNESLELLKISNNNNFIMNDSIICLPLTVDMKIFCLERLSQLVSINQHRVQDVLHITFNHFQNLIQNLTQMHSHILFDDCSLQYFLERITVCVFKLCLELAAKYAADLQMNKLKIHVILFLNEFHSIQSDRILQMVGRRMIAGIKLLVCQSCHLLFETEKDWKIVLFLLKRFGNCQPPVHAHGKQCCVESFNVLKLISQQYLNSTNFAHVLSVLAVFGDYQQSSAVHYKQVIELILSLHSRLPTITNNNAMLGQMWHKSLSCIAQFGAYSDFKTRRFAINSLHKALLQYPIKFEEKSHAEPSRLLFETVLLPLLLEVTRLENQRLNADTHHPKLMANKTAKNGTHTHTHDGNASETENVSSEAQNDLRLKLLSLVFQVWLHELSNLIILDDFDCIWYKFLATMKQFLYQCMENEFLVTHCIESLKNVILVFQSSKVFEKVSERTNTNVWQKTWTILADVTPLKQEFDG